MAWETPISDMVHHLHNVWADKGTITTEVHRDGDNATVHAYLHGRRIDVRTVTFPPPEPDTPQRRPTPAAPATTPPLGTCICGHPTWTVIDGTPMHACCAREGANCEPCRISRAAALRRHANNRRPRKAA